MTLPSLINNYQKQVAINQFKVAYQKVSEALERAKADNGGELLVTSDMLEDFSTYGNSDTLSRTFLDPYFSNVKLTSKNDYKQITTPANESFIIGSRVMCTNNLCYALIGSGTNVFVNYVRLFVDTNGRKGPNKMGKDCFLLYLNISSHYTPFRINGISPNLNKTREEYKESCNKTASGLWNGDSCAYLLINDNWKILNDYPW